MSEIEQAARKLIETLLIFENCQEANPGSDDTFSRRISNCLNKDLYDLKALVTWSNEPNPYAEEESK